MICLEIISFMHHAFVLYKKVITIPKVTQIFSYVIFQEFHSFTIYMKVCVSFWVNFCDWCNIYIQVLSSSFFFLHVDVQCFQHHLVKRLYFLHSVVFASLAKLTLFVWVYFWCLYSVPLIYLSIFSPIRYSLLITVAL